MELGASEHQLQISVRFKAYGSRATFVQQVLEAQTGASGNFMFCAGLSDGTNAVHSFQIAAVFSWHAVRQRGGRERPKAGASRCFSTCFCNVWRITPEHLRPPVLSLPQYTWETNFNIEVCLRAAECCDRARRSVSICVHAKKQPGALKKFQLRAHAAGSQLGFGSGHRSAKAYSCSLCCFIQCAQYFGKQVMLVIGDCFQGLATPRLLAYSPGWPYAKPMTTYMYICMENIMLRMGCGNKQPLGCAGARSLAQVASHA